MRKPHIRQTRIAGVTLLALLIRKLFEGKDTFFVLSAAQVGN